MVLWETLDMESWANPSGPSGEILFLLKEMEAERTCSCRRESVELNESESESESESQCENENENENERNRNWKRAEKGDGKEKELTNDKVSRVLIGQFQAINYSAG